MAKRRVMLTFPQELLREPVIHTLGQQFMVVTNIHRADIAEDEGWAVLELEGEEEDIDRGLAWATSKGVRVEAVIGDAGEG